MSNRPFKILQIMAGGAHGGAETAFVDMCIAMKEAGQHVEVVTRANDIRVSALEKAGLKVHTLRFGGGLDFKTPRSLKSIIKNFQPDIVQSWMSRAPHKTPQWSKSFKIPRYLHVSRLGGYYKTKYFQSCDYFVTITPDIKRHLVDNRIAEEKIKHINNFAETESVVTPICRADKNVPEDATLLLGLGRLHPSKAFDTLIKATAELDNTYLWIAGEGPQRQELEELIESLNLQERVKLLGWRSDRASLLQACDICVFSSRYEPFGTVFVQAWAQRTTLVTTCSDGPRQFVRNEEDGLVVPIDDIPAMKNAIEKVANDKEFAGKLVEKGYQRYINEFTKEKSIESYLDFYNTIRKIEDLP